MRMSSLATVERRPGPTGDGGGARKSSEFDMDLIKLMHKCLLVVFFRSEQ